MAVDNACVVELEPDMLTAAEEEAPRDRVDGDWKGNVVGANEVAETAGVDCKLMLGKEDADAIPPDELAGNAIVAVDGNAEEETAPNIEADWVEGKVDTWEENKVDGVEKAEEVANLIALVVSSAGKDDGV